MNWELFGLVDIILIVGAIITMIVGFKKGFLTKVLSLVGVLAILVFAIFTSSAFAGFLEEKHIIFDGLQAKFEGNILTASGGYETASEALAAALNINTTIAGWLLKMFKVDVDINYAKEISIVAARICMKGIAFLILFFGGLLLLLILKLVAKFVRTNAVIRVIDGLLGVVLYAAIYAVIIAGIFTLLYLIVDQWGWIPEGAQNWIHTDFKVVVDHTDSGIIVTQTRNTLSGAIYKSNPFMMILRLFGVK